MKKIYKFPLEVTDEVTIQIPRDAEVLGVQVQTGQICLWAKVDPTGKEVSRTFRIIGTGYSIADEKSLTYIGTIQLHGGSLVFHIFEKKE